MQSVAFVNMKGGVAKTTLAVNVAHCLCRREDKRVLLIDLDPQFNATQCIFSGEDYVKLRMAGGHTILNIFDDVATTTISPVKGATSMPAVKLEEIKPWPTSRGFDLIPGDLELYRLEMGAASGRELRLKRFLDKAIIKDNYDFVIIDTPPTPSHWMISGLLASQAYVVPVKPEPLSRVGVDLLRGVIDRCSENHGHSIACLGVVLTIVDRRTLVFGEAVEFLDANPLWKDKRFEADLPSRTAIARAQGRQILILDTDQTDAKTALARITTEFLERAEDV
jgi:chromosome partitioning protein